ncbi:hypothetical protein [Nocardia arthritidis]|uniref:hypothetical protein n=1 Tax=Nocardia arthritidis TaxID=228602 RepID=UPI001EEA1B35|nr:hypothetical protein [Nocardia arthritidis]
MSNQRSVSRPVVAIPWVCGGALGVAVIGAVFVASFHPESVSSAAAAGHALAVASFGTFAIAGLAGIVVFLLPKAAQS